MWHDRISKACVVTVMSLMFFAVHAEVYQWTDENGKVRFSDHAPPVKDVKDISEELRKTNLDHASGQTKARAATSEKTEDEKALEEKRKQELETAIGEHCRKLKADIASIARGDRGTFMDKDGKELLVLERDRSKILEEWKSGYVRMGCNKLQPLE